MSSKKNTEVREKSCFVCGNSKFTWGNLSIGKSEDEHRGKVFFREYGMSYRDGDVPISVRHCVDCGNVLMFINEVK